MTQSTVCNSLIQDAVAGSSLFRHSSLWFPVVLISLRLDITGFRSSVKQNWTSLVDIPTLFHPWICPANQVRRPKKHSGPSQSPLLLIQNTWKQNISDDDTRQCNMTNQRKDIFGLAEWARTINLEQFGCSLLVLKSKKFVGVETCNTNTLSLTPNKHIDSLVYRLPRLPPPQATPASHE